MRERLGIDAGDTRVHRDEAARGGASRLAARAFTQGSEIFLPAEAGPLESVGVQALLAHELTHVSQQRRLGSSLPSESSPMGARLEEDASRVERSWQADASLPLAGSRRSPSAVSQEVSSVSRVESVSAGASAGSAPADFSPAEISFSEDRLQRASSEASPMPSQSGGGSPSSGGAAPSVSTDRELDELARKLYERIRSRIRGELLIDRERAGMLTDLR
jgi:DNA-binding PucR family transcriptional regulator